VLALGAAIAPALRNYRRRERGTASAS
jgi:hypothetical protein